ncbi:MAG TPA: hypothetical protein VF224_09690, partial [Aestuariivirga sp.]
VVLGRALWLLVQVTILRMDLSTRSLWISKVSLSAQSLVFECELVRRSQVCQSCPIAYLPANPQAATQPVFGGFAVSRAELAQVPQRPRQPVAFERGSAASRLRVFDAAPQEFSLAFCISS